MPIRPRHHVTPTAGHTVRGGLRNQREELERWYKLLLLLLIQRDELSLYRPPNSSKLARANDDLDSTWIHEHFP